VHGPDQPSRRAQPRTCRPRRRPPEPRGVTGCSADATRAAAV
jgi:hypothetical protein